MRIYEDIDLATNEWWCGAQDTMDAIIDAGKVDAFESLLNEITPADGWCETTINDLLRFDDDFIFEQLGMSSAIED